MSKNKEMVTLKLTSAIAFDGAVMRAGSMVELPEDEARKLLDRGRAVLATEKNAKPEQSDAERTKTLQETAAKEAEDAAVARAMKDNELDETAFLALSNTKRNALVKAAHEAIAKDAAA